jgi:hypothetical protein
MEKQTTEGDGTTKEMQRTDKTKTTTVTQNEAPGQQQATTND